MAKEPLFVIYGLYCLCHPELGIRYVGQSSRSARTRFYHHTYAARKSKPWAVARWMAKHGIENIRYEILEVFDDAAGLDEAEAKWIIELKTLISEGGYNLRAGGNSVRGYKHRDDARSKMTGWTHSPETRKKLSEAGRKRVGAETGNAKMTDDTVREIKYRHWMGESGLAIAAATHVSNVVVSDVTRWKSWTHVLGPIGPPRFSGNGYFAKGTIPTNAKLTEEVVREIRRRYEAGERPRDLGPEFGVTPENVCQIGLRRTWKHVL